MPTYLQHIITNVIGKCLVSDNSEQQKQAISTLSACACALGESFNIYLPKVIQLLDSLMVLRSEDKIGLRAEATSCLGSVAGAVGFKSFQNILPKFHAYVMNGLMDMDDSDIREASFMYFSELAYRYCGQCLMKCSISYYLSWRTTTDSWWSCPTMASARPKDNLT